MMLSIIRASEYNDDLSKCGRTLRFSNPGNKEQEENWIKEMIEYYRKEGLDNFVLMRTVLLGGTRSHRTKELLSEVEIKMRKNKKKEQDPYPFGLEIELPPWKRPEPIPVKIIIKSVEKGKFRPIRDDEIDFIE